MYKPRSPKGNLLRKSSVPLKFSSELIFLGTGSSSCTPNTSCLTAEPVTCYTCKDAINRNSKNRRRNTSALILSRWIGKDSDGEFIAYERVIILDVGKTFYTSTIDIFPKHRIREIDAVIITHGHADAFFGLDDLRDFTRNLEKPLDIYVAHDDFHKVIKNTFPYLVNVSDSTGSGFVSSLNFICFDPNSAIEVCGVEFIPLKVDHGPPFFCLGYGFGNTVYISDCSSIPPETDLMIKKRGEIGVMILDGLSLTRPCKSHWSLEDSIKAFEIYTPHKGYIVGVAHNVEYNEGNEFIKSRTKLDIKLSYDGLTVPIILNDNLMDKDE